MATRARPLLLCLFLCFASCLSSSSHSDEPNLEERRQLAAAGNGYRATAFLVDQERRRLAAELVPLAVAGGGSAAHGGDVQRLDVYASGFLFFLDHQLPRVRNSVNDEFHIFLVCIYYSLGSIIDKLSAEKM